MSIALAVELFAVAVVANALGSGGLDCREDWLLGTLADGMGEASGITGGEATLYVIAQ